MGVYESYVSTTHPREGYVVEVWHGLRRSPEVNRRVNVLVEIHEVYRQDGSGPSYHYRPHLLNGGEKMTKTIGPMDLDRMRDFAKKYTAPGEDVEWRQLR